MVLAAGFGLRLRPLTLERAKPACPVVNRPLIHFPLSRLAAAGVRAVVVNTHHLPDTVRAALDAFDDADLHFTVLHESEILGTGGGLKNARRYFASDDLLILQNGDTICEADLAEAVRAHRDSGALATLVLLDDPRVERYGAVEVAADSAVVDIAGLRRQRGARRGLFVGTHVLSPEIFSHLPAREAFCIIRDAYLPLLSSRPGAVRAHFTNGRFFDLGAPADYLAANWSLLENPGPFSFWRKGLSEVAPGLWQGEDIKLASNAILRPPLLLGNRVRVELGASLGPRVIVGDNATVAANAGLSRGVVWDGARVAGRESDAILTTHNETLENK
jgi:mannose-1-phosphate guanylyltransferase